MTIPVPVLDDRSFDQLVTEARARVPVHTPEWTNLNENDPGVTVLELFAFLTDNLLYRSNRIPEANRLKFLSMLGVQLQPASPGVGLVTFTNDKAALAPTVFPASTELRSGPVRFLTDTALEVLPVTAATFVKQPQQLSGEALARYRLLYQTFLASDAEELTFYRPVALEPPTTGKPDPVVDLGDPVSGTIDRSLWVALIGQRGASREEVRKAIGGRNLSIGVYPTAKVPGQVLLPERVGGPDTDPGLVVEIAAPVAGDPASVALGIGGGPAAYRALPTTYAEPVLDRPGIIQVTLPPYEDLLVWDFDPAEEGTGDYPPRLDDPQLSSRVVTWVRLRYPPLGPGAGGAAADAASAGAADAGAGADAEDETGTPHQDEPDCGCGGSHPAAARDLSVGGCTGCADASEVGTPSDTPAAATLPGRITWVGVNATRAVQAVSVVHEQLAMATGNPHHTCRFAHAPVLTRALPGAPTDPVTVEVQGTGGGQWETWRQVDDLLAAGPDDPVYQLDPAAGTLTFGSGLHGRRPVRGARVRASYWFGGGSQGRVPVAAIDRSIDLPGGYTLGNPLPTWGAGDGEDVASGEARITQWLRHRDRLVTTDDFRDLTRRTPGIDLGRVEVLPLFNPDVSGVQDWPGMVTVLVVPRADPVHPANPVPDRQFLDAVCDWLSPRRLVTTEVHVRGPVYVPVWVSVAVVPQPGYLPALVNQAVTDAVSTFLSPLTGGLPASGGGGGSGWPLGVNLRAQDVEAIATRVPGVRYVEGVRLAQAGSGGAVVGVDTVTLTGLQLPQATVLAGAPPVAEPASLVAGSQAVPPTYVAVPVLNQGC